MELGELVQRLRQDYPKGLSGERDALVTLLVQRGYPHAEAVRLAQALETQGYAHFLPGAKSRWFFTEKPLDLQALMRALDQEYREFVGEGDEEEEALAFLTAQLEGDRAVAREVLEALRLAGYVETAYSPELERNRLFFRFPEALRLWG
jgi:phosphoglycolate phosphatase-like HAD superfamily hydrolase